MKPLVAAVAVLVAIAACGCGSSSQLPIGEVYESVSGRTHLVVQTDTEVDVLGFDTADLSSNQVYRGTYRIQEDGRVRVSVPAYGRALRVFSLEPIDEGLREVDSQGTLTTILFDRQHRDKGQFHLWRIQAKEGGTLLSSDEQDALTSWTLAKEGDAEAQRNLGVMYANGLGVPQDDAEAVRWLRLAAGQGYAAAQFTLGLWYDYGVDIPQDDIEAVRWYRLAADQGDARAQSNLAIMYQNGKGVPQDYVQAHIWYNLAASRMAGGHRQHAVDGRDRAAGQMNPTQIAEAERFAREWDAAHPQ